MIDPHIEIPALSAIPVVLPVHWLTLYAKVTVSEIRSELLRAKYRLRLIVDGVHRFSVQGKHKSCGVLLPFISYGAFPIKRGETPTESTSRGFKKYKCGTLLVTSVVEVRVVPTVPRSSIE